MELTIGLLSFQLYFLEIQERQGHSLGVGEERRAGSAEGIDARCQK